LCESHGWINHGWIILSILLANPSCILHAGDNGRQNIKEAIRIGIDPGQSRTCCPLQIVQRFKSDSTRPVCHSTIHDQENSQVCAQGEERVPAEHVSGYMGQVAIQLQTIQTTDVRVMKVPTRGNLESRN